MTLPFRAPSLCFHAVICASLFGSCTSPGPGASESTPASPGPDASESTPAPARASSFEMFGALRAVMHEADYGSKVSLGEVLEQPGAHGVGALQGLGGELTLLDGVAWVSTPGADGVRTERLETGAGSEVGVAMLALERVPSWSRQPLGEASTAAQLGERVRAAAEAAGLPLDAPIPFRIDGRLEALRYHVIDGTRLPPGPSSHEAHQAAGLITEHASVEGTLVGMWSTRHAGVFTHMGDSTHVHVVVPEPLGSGHVDAVRVPADALLGLPVAR